MEDQMQIFSIALFIGVIFAIIILSNAIRVLREYERGVVFRLGRLIGAKGTWHYFSCSDCGSDGQGKFANRCFGCPSARRHHQR